MKTKKTILGLILIALGMVGIASILTMDLPIPADVKTVLEEKYTAEQIKMLILINPIILLIIAVFGGTILYQKVNLRVPIIESLVGIESKKIDFLEIIKFGVLGGIISGFLISLMTLLFNPILPAEFLEIGESLKPTLAARFLYGGITEEILMRFGFMTLIVWVFSKILKRTSSTVYWIGILISTLLFALGHFPIAFQAVENPSFGLLSYILIGNSVAGIFFGWLYWKKGLESAMIAHVFAHIVMVLAETLS